MALSLKKINSNWLLLGAAILLGGGAAYLGGAALKQRMHELDEQANAGKDMVSVVVARRDMQRGEPVEPDSFAVRKVPSEYLNADAVKPGDFEPYVTQRLIVGLKRGDVLLPVHTEGNGNKVFSSTLGVGKRALTFEVDTVNSVSGMLRPGDRIDLLATVQRDHHHLTLPLLQGVRVLATGSRTRPGEDDGAGDPLGGSFGTLTLDLSEEEATRLVAARALARLTAVLRHPRDTSTAPLQRTDALALLGLAPPAREAGVPVIYGGIENPALVPTPSPLTRPTPRAEPAHDPD